MLKIYLQILQQSNFYFHIIILCYLFSLTNDSMEIVLRRAGDLAFLFQNYEFAYTNYYSAKRDLSREQAPTFYAGVLVRHFFFIFFFELIIH